MNAAMVLGLIDPMGGKVTRSNYELQDSDYVIQGGENPADLSSQYNIDESALEGMLPGDVIPYDAPDREEINDRISPDDIDRGLFELTVGDEMTDEFMSKVSELDIDDYENLENSLVMEYFQKKQLEALGSDNPMEELDALSKQMKPYQRVGSRLSETVNDIFGDTLKMAGEMYKYDPEEVKGREEKKARAKRRKLRMDEATKRSEQRDFNSPDEMNKFGA